MQKFSYSAKNKEGVVVSGIIEATSEKEANKILGGQHLFVLEIKSSESNAKRIFTWRKKVGLKDKIIFTKELAMMIHGGLPLVESLLALEEQTESKSLSQAVNSIRKEVEGGTPLSKAMDKYPKIFPPLYVSVVASGEQSGKLDEVLERQAEQLEKDYDLITKVKNAVTYPAVIVIALIGIVILMLVFVVPQLKGIFDEIGVTLPLPTRILLGTSDFMVRFWYLVIGFIVGIYFALKYWGKTPSGHLILDRMKIRVPIFGKLVQKIYLARFTRTAATLIASGLPMLEIIKTSKNVIGNQVYVKAFDVIYTDVESGVTLSNALKKHKIFPPIISHMTAMGEKSGKVDTVLFNVADFYDKEVEATTGNLTALIEPILIIVIGAGVGAAIAAVLLPIYSLAQAI